MNVVLRKKLVKFASHSIAKLIICVYWVNFSGFYWAVANYSRCISHRSAEGKRPGGGPTWWLDNGFWSTASLSRHLPLPLMGFVYILRHQLKSSNFQNHICFFIVLPQLTIIWYLENITNWPLHRSYFWNNKFANGLIKGTVSRDFCDLQPT